MFFRRERVEQHALAGGLQSAAGQTLQHARGDQHVQTRRHSAQRRRDGEDEDREQKIIAPAEPDREPAGDRQNDGIGREITGDDPFAIGHRCRQPAGDVAQRHIRDRRVQHFHESGNDDGERHDPRIDRRAEPPRAG